MLNQLQFTRDGKENGMSDIDITCKPENCNVNNLYCGTDKEDQNQAWKDGLHKSETPIEMYTDNGIYVKFKSQSEASRITGIPQANIWECLAGKRKTEGGYKWRKLG